MNTYTRALLMLASGASLLDLAERLGGVTVARRAVHWLQGAGYAHLDGLRWRLTDEGLDLAVDIRERRAA